MTAHVATFLATFAATLGLAFTANAMPGDMASGTTSGMSSGAPGKAKAKHAFVQWIAESDAAKPGTDLLMGLWVQLEPGWHVYWKNPGDAGLPIRLKWQLPAGFVPDSLQWPTPDTISAPPLMNYGYGGTVILPFHLRLPENFAEKTVLSAHAKWLVCQEICLPEEADLSLEIAPAPQGMVKPSPFAEDLQAAVAKLPLKSSPWPLEVSLDAQWVNLHVTPPADFDAEAGLWFYPENGEWMNHAAPESLLQSNKPGKWRLQLERVAPNAPLPERLRGIVVAHGPLEKGGLTRAFEVDLAWPSNPTRGGSDGGLGTIGEDPRQGSTGNTGQPNSDQAGGLGNANPSAPPSANGGFWNLFVKLALAFAGGLILNLMPCVLPVLSLKIFDFVQRAGHARWRVFAHGLTFTLGVLVSFWFLAGLLLILRQGGEKLGWGYQLQSPSFLVVLCALFFFFSLNLFGVFEMGYFFTRLGKSGGHGSSGHLGSFLAGVTATVVATPCTAPFMGSAMGFAFTQSAGVALLVFTWVGLGMAFPYLLLSGFPGLMRILPKPGEWMLHLKQFMGFPLLGTAIWLAWILGRQAGLEALIALLAVLLLAGISAWILGKWAALHQEKPVRIVAILAALVVFVPAFVMVLLFVQQTAHATRENPDSLAYPGGQQKKEVLGVWEPFNAQKADIWVKSGKPLFIDFTADWCLSCKVNERIALENHDVQEKLKRLGVGLMKADWTRSDAHITQALAAYGRQSVPLYVLYPGPTPDRVHILPEILTPSILLDALDSIVPASESSASAPESRTGVL